MQSRYKYPRTPHIPQSPGATNDDKVLNDLNHLMGQQVVITEKMDGENTTLYSDYYSHARSIDSQHHPSRNWVKAFHSEIGHQINTGWRICGENLYARHSIPYDELESYFYAFSIWDESNFCISWNATVIYCNHFGITTVPVLWKGLLTESILNLLIQNLDLEKQEGLVIRLAAGFEYNKFDKSVAKYVRKNHVTTDKHWMSQAIITNGLKDQFLTINN